jgi:hypothetical protein
MCLVIRQDMWILCLVCSMELVLPNELKCHICDFSKVCDFYRTDTAQNISLTNNGLVKLYQSRNTKWDTACISVPIMSAGNLSRSAGHISS